jgi:hypothetical protein
MTDIDPMRTLEQIARMRIFPDDKVNRITLVAAIEMARTVVAAKLAIERMSAAQEGTAP